MEGENADTLLPFRSKVMNRLTMSDDVRFRFCDGRFVITAVPVVLRTVSDMFLFRTIILEPTDTVKR